MTKELLAKLGITAEQDYTDDEVVEAVLKMLKGKDDTITSHKALIDRYTGEISALKKEKEARMTEEEKREAHLKELEEENANYKKASAVAERKALYLGLGYSEELAGKIATAEIEGQPVAEYHKQHQEELIKKTLAGNLDRTPNPQTTTTQITKEQFDKMGYDERLKLYNENPTLYEQLSKEN